MKTLYSGKVVKYLRYRRKARKGFFSFAKSAIISFAMWSMESCGRKSCRAWNEDTGFRTECHGKYKRDMNEDQKNEDSNYW